MWNYLNQKRNEIVDFIVRSEPFYLNIELMQLALHRGSNGRKSCVFGVVIDALDIKTTIAVPKAEKSMYAVEDSINSNSGRFLGHLCDGPFTSRHDSSR
jgi:hypothetical protein